MNVCVSLTLLVDHSFRNLTFLDAGCAEHVLPLLAFYVLNSGCMHLQKYFSICSRFFHGFSHALLGCSLDDFTRKPWPHDFKS
jgi:hypothetical protein